MPFTPPSHTPFQWQDTPSVATPLDTANLEAAETDLVTYTQTADAALATYIEAELPYLTSTPSNLVIAGHSFLDPAGVTMKHSPGSAYSVGARVAAKLGVQSGQVSNQAKSGAVIRSHLSNGTPKYLQAFDPGNTVVYPQIPQVGMVFAWFGANDIILGFGSGVQNGFINNYVALVSWMRACWAADYNHTTVTPTGAWTPVTYATLGTPAWGQGAGCTGSTTVGNSITINLAPGGTHVATHQSSVVVGVRFVTAPNGGTAQVLLDGVAQGTFDTHGNNFDFNNLDERGSAVFRVPVTTSNSTITVNVQSISGGGPLYFDGWHVEAPIPPLFLIGEFNTPGIIQGLANNQTPTNIDTANTWIDTVVSTFNDKTVRKVYLDAPLGKATIRANGQGTSLANVNPANLLYYGDDGLHPNDAGARVVAAEIQKEAIRAFSLDNVTPATISSYAPWEHSPITALQAEIYHGSGAPLGLLDNFDVVDSNTAPAGWSPLMGEWGVYQKGLALYHDQWPADDSSQNTNFNLPNGGPPGGWTTVSGTWAISSNELKNTAVAGGGVRPIILSPYQLNSSGNGGISFTVGAAQENYAGIVFRYQDATNYWRLSADVTFGGWFLEKVVAGVNTVVLNITLQYNATGTQMHVECNGNTIQIWDEQPGGVLGASLIGTATDSALATARDVGFTTWSTFGSGPSWSYLGVRASPFVAGDPQLPFSAIVRDLGFSDGVISWVNGAGTPTDLAGVMFRYVDHQNYMYLAESATFGGWTLTYVIGGSATTLGGSNYRLPATPGAIVEVVMAGNDFTVYVNGQITVAGTQTIASAPAGTKAGPMAYPQKVSSFPNTMIDSFSSGQSQVSVPDTAYYRDDNSGNLYGPFVDGAYSDQMPWLPNDSISIKDINTTGLSSAQIDTHFAITPTDGRFIADSTNKLLLVRQSGKWYKSAALTLIS